MKDIEDPEYDYVKIAKEDEEDEREFELSSKDRVIIKIDNTVIDITKTYKGYACINLYKYHSDKKAEYFLTDEIKLTE